MRYKDNMKGLAWAWDLEGQESFEFTISKKQFQVISRFLGVDVWAGKEELLGQKKWSIFLLFHVKFSRKHYWNCQHKKCPNIRILWVYLSQTDGNCRKAKLQRIEKMPWKTTVLQPYFIHYNQKRKHKGVTWNPLAIDEGGWRKQSGETCGFG